MKFQIPEFGDSPSVVLVCVQQGLSEHFWTGQIGLPPTGNVLRAESCLCHKASQTPAVGVMGAAAN